MNKKLKKKYYREFLSYFSYLKNAGLILSGDFYKPRAEQMTKEIEQVVNQFINQGTDLVQNVLYETDRNLYNIAKGDRETYISSILKSFTPFAPYLNYTDKRELEDGSEGQMIKIINKKHRRVIDNCHELILRYELKYTEHFDDLTIPQQYIILCFHAYRDFFNRFDAMCLNFNLDLMGIQRKNELLIWERDTSALLKLGYSFENISGEKIQYLKGKNKSSEIKKVNNQLSPEKPILFDSPETIDKLYKELRGYFSGKEKEFRKTLNGEKLSSPLFFPHNQNKFVEVFKRLKYNGFLLSTSTEIRDWICENFEFRYSKGKPPESRPFNKSSVWDILTKEKYEPTKKARICNPDWLPYISYSRRQRDTEKEQL